MSGRPVLTGVLAEIAGVIGEAQAVKVAEQLGGLEVKLSSSPREDSLLAGVVGVDDAAALGEAFGPVKLVIPCGGFRGQGGRVVTIRRLLRQGWSHSRVAAAADVHLRTVERHAAALRGDDGQPSLFD